MATGPTSPRGAGPGSATSLGDLLLTTTAVGIISAPTGAGALVRSMLLPTTVRRSSVSSAADSDSALDSVSASAAAMAGSRSAGESPFIPGITAAGAIGT